MKYRLFIFGFLTCLIGTQALIWWMLYPISPWIALVVSLTVFVGFTMLAHSNFNRLTPWLVSQEDRFFLNCIEVNPYAERRLYRLLPADPRCGLCLVPFGGVGKALHITPSQKNPNFCKGCIESAPFGVEDIDAGILFADIRGYTEWSEKRLCSRRLVRRCP